MNSWNQNQNQTQNNMVMGQAQFNPYQQNMWGNYAQSRLPIYHADPLHGENAAWQFPMGPNSDIWLPDANEDIIWWIRVDANGNRTVQDFDVTPHQKPEPIDMNAILARIDALEDKVNAKQNKSNAKRSSNTAVDSNIEPAATTNQ